MSLRTLLTTLLLTASCSAMAATGIVPLNNRTSDDLLPVARDFLGKDGKVSAYGNQLIVNAEPGKIEELRALIEQLDTVPRRLLITVDTNENNFQNDQGHSINGVAQTRIINRSTESRDGGIQQVQASEGMPALIQVGQSVPLTTSQTDMYGRAPNQTAASTPPQTQTSASTPLQNQTDTYGHLQSQTQYRNVTQGFYVTASVTGETVHLSISTNRDRMNQERADVVNIQSTDTTVSGRLGEWITLAGVNRQTQADKQALARSYSTQGRDDMTLRVKVDDLDQSTKN